ncbi:MAG: histidinol-phosphate aminotransferase family protein [Oscillospiraceae bacterium]|nr:histidinol-phosphate aminotransferase family protein [Oscillospiraceae bacterium]
MFQLSNTIKNLVPYDPIMGDFAVRLDANESFIPMGDAEQAAILAALTTTDLRRYPDHAATKLCQAAAAFYGTKPGLLTAFNGADEALFVLCSAFLGADKTLLCYQADFSMYRFYAQVTGANIVQLPKRDDYTIDVDATINALREHKPALFMFSNPCNPTSILLGMDDVRRLIHAANETGTLLVHDEAYMDFADQSLLDEIEQYSNLIILRTLSKAAGMAGLRLGFAAANAELTRALRALKSPYNVGALTQAIGTAILCQPQRLTHDITQIRKSCDELATSLRELGLQVIGSAANFVFVRDAAQYFEPLKQRGIVVRCLGEHLRITAGSPEENAAVLGALLFLQKK